MSTLRAKNVYGVVLLTRLRVGLSHLREHKFKHGFQDTINPFCNCQTNSIETTKHYLLHCSNFPNERLHLFTGLRYLDMNIFPLNPVSLCQTLLFGDPIFSDNMNRNILNLVINFILDSQRFSGPLFLFKIIFI